MSADTFALTQADLLAHREFVVRLARRLVGDSAADDVVQETWLVALRRRWNHSGTARGWLAKVVRSQARAHVRSTSRRAARETSAARSEVDDSDTALRERLSLQQSVAAAVLALREPYRSLVILRHYEELSTAQIAARRGVPEGTIRSQLSRAYDELRESLDGRHGGRKAWSAALTGWLARESKPLAAASAAGPLVWLTSASIVALSIAWLVQNRGDDRASDTDGAAPRVARAGNAANFDEPAASEASLRAAATVGDARPPVAASSESLEALIMRARELEAALRRQVLTPAPELEARFAAQLADPSWGLVRLLDFKHCYPNLELAGLGCGTSGYSFEARLRDCVGVDLWLEGDRLKCTRGSGAGLLIDLGDAPLERIDRSEPSFLDEHQRAAWEWCWTAKLQMPPRDAPEQWRAIRKTREEPERLRLEFTEPAVVLDHSYLQRAEVDGHHDLVIAFRVVAVDEWGCTLLWRQVAAWEVTSRAPSARFEPTPEPEPPVSVPAELRDRSISELLELRRELRTRATPVALAVPDELRARSPSSRFVRLMDGPHFETLLATSQGASEFSFATADYGWRVQPNIRYQTGRFWFHCYGGQICAALDLGDVALDNVGFAPPPSLAPALAEAWRFLWDAEFGAEPQPGERRSDVDKRAMELGLAADLPPVLDHTYVLRSIRPREHDQLTAFRVVALDRYGATLAWRVVTTWATH